MRIGDLINKWVENVAEKVIDDVLDIVVDEVDS